MRNESVRLQYIKDVLGIKSVIIPEGLAAQAQDNVAFSFQTFNEGPVLFLSDFKEDGDKNFSVEELQLLEKIIIALKLDFQKTDIAKVKTDSKSQLAKALKSKNYSYVFLLGEGISKIFGSVGSTEFTDEGLKFFSTFHPQEMIKNPDLKKDAWAGFKSIMENLPR